MAKKRVVRRKKVPPSSVGLGPADVRAPRSVEIERLAGGIEQDGGAVLASYREPFGGTEVVLAALPVDRVEPTPYQRDPSDAHVRRLMTVVERLGRFLDPIIAVRRDGGYWTPNGNHRLQALRRLGVRAVVALVVPDPTVAFKILALNTEKAHNLREKSLETIRMARELARISDDREADHAFEFEEPAYLTLGLGYEQRPRLSGGGYQPLLKRIDEFLDVRLAQALETRSGRAHRLLAIDDRVNRIVQALRDRGLTSPYLKPFVIARINPIRFSKATAFDFDAVLEKMAASAATFNPEKVKQEDVARAGGAPAEAE